MKIALLGYGKMGHVIESIALQRNHEIPLIIDNQEDWNLKEQDLAACDVAIDFSTPATAVHNIEKCFSHHIPVVVGTTGWYGAYESLAARCTSEHQSLFVASNFSIGVNILFELNQRLAAIMNRYPDYSPSIVETHHIHKLDAPSGTAVTLASGLLQEMDRLDSWALTDAGKDAPAPESRVLPITAIREGEVPGIHEITYDSPFDTLSLRHSAKSRQGFAAGAVLAAEYLVAHPGLRTMKDLLQ